MFSSCQNRKLEPASSPQTRINSVIYKYNENLAKMPSQLNTRDKNLIAEVFNDIYSESMNTENTKLKIENYKKYVDKIALSLFSYSRIAKYSLDSLAIKENHSKEGLVLIEALKKKFEMNETQITNFKTKTMLVASNCNLLIDIREKCPYKFVNGGMTFSKISCEDDFNTIVLNLNKYVNSANEIMKDLFKPK